MVCTRATPFRNTVGTRKRLFPDCLDPPFQKHFDFPQKDFSGEGQSEGVFIVTLTGAIPI